jgi:hypothetical protein
MAALIIPSTTSFGVLTNQTVARLLSLNTSMERLKDAIATASSGYTGTPGTEVEAPVMAAGQPYVPPNNFGVVAAPDAPGENGTDYAYAVNTLAAAWATFWTAAQPSIEQLDNGVLG